MTEGTGGVNKTGLVETRKLLPLALDDMPGVCKARARPCPAAHLSRTEKKILHEAPKREEAVKLFTVDDFITRREKLTSEGRNPSDKQREIYEQELLVFVEYLTEVAKLYNKEEPRSTNAFRLAQTLRPNTAENEIQRERPHDENLEGLAKLRGSAEILMTKLAQFDDGFEWADLIKKMINSLQVHGFKELLETPKPKQVSDNPLDRDSLIAELEANEINTKILPKKDLESMIEMLRMMRTPVDQSLFGRFDGKSKERLFSNDGFKDLLDYNSSEFDKKSFKKPVFFHFQVAELPKYLDERVYEILYLGKRFDEKGDLITVDYAKAERLKQIRYSLEGVKIKLARYAKEEAKASLVEQDSSLSQEELETLLKAEEERIINKYSPDKLSIRSEELITSNDDLLRDLYSQFIKALRKSYIKENQSLIEEHFERTDAEKTALSRGISVKELLAERNAEMKRMLDLHDANASPQA